MNGRNPGRPGSPERPFDHFTYRYSETSTAIGGDREKRFFYHEEHEVISSCSSCSSWFEKGLNWVQAGGFVDHPMGWSTIEESLQHDISIRKHEVDDRDLVVFEILGVRTSKREGIQLDPHTAASLRKRSDISPKAFSLILVGKDGGIKLRKNDPVKLEEIFRLIDSMPMRQDEMRQKVRSF